MGKIFLVDPAPQQISKEDILQSNEEKNKAAKLQWEENRKRAAEAVRVLPPLKHVKGKVVIAVDVQFKNAHTFADGTQIFLGRQFNNFNRRETEPVNALVIDAENIPSGAEVLIHHNSIHDTYRIFDCEDLAQNVPPEIQYYAIKEEECFLWRKDEVKWNPCGCFETALRVFEPYTGAIEGIPPTALKNTLYVTSGDLAGTVVATVKAADYEIVFRNENGVEERVIRFRPFGDKKTKRVPEAIMIDHALTDKVHEGILHVGISEKDCAPIAPQKKQRRKIKNSLDYKTVTIL